jgi:hypothetical protein
MMFCAKGRFCFVQNGLSRFSSTAKHTSELLGIYILGAYVRAGTASSGKDTNWSGPGASAPPGAIGDGLPCAVGILHAGGALRWRPA